MMKNQKIRHTARREEKTIQRYPIVKNKPGDKVFLKLKDDRGDEYEKPAEILALYRNFVLVYVGGKYRTAIHKTEFGQYKGAKVQW